MGALILSYLFCVLISDSVGHVHLATFFCGLQGHSGKLVSVLVAARGTPFIPPDTIEVQDHGSGRPPSQRA